METDEPRLPEQPSGQLPASHFPASLTPPEAPGDSQLPPEAAGPARSWLTGTVWGCALLAVGGGAVLMVLLTALSTNGFRQYGFMVFVSAPFLCGLVTNILFVWLNPERPTRNGAVAGAVVTLLTVQTALALMVASALEGMICVLMAAPLALLAAWAGALVGAAGHRAGLERHRVPVLSLLVLLYPVGQLVEMQHSGPPKPHRVSTRLRVRATPEQVWRVLIGPVQYPTAVGPFFRAGVAYPLSTAVQLDSAGRRTLTCAYSQGRAHLPITGWQPGRELAFQIPNTPAPMRELSPYPRIHAPHLHGYFSVDRGTFRLLPQPDGSTVLEATTVYRHSIGPRAYWQLWSDYLLDDMHQRVLTALKTQAEHE
ncbi:hypothetical protein [Hymenobacter sp. CRA2]|uniref:hypothetical protein n=1 Tax=Hymenobacter sp. CRA2 TaxID=1955620 RepID=UPI00098F5CE3|nr:hypothetical protein [Hymenobacter sp. CRA2]OON69372.1 hypothetical protein B0919_08805 [Hymenobacter sp. CRA2]